MRRLLVLLLLLLPNVVAVAQTPAPTPELGTYMTVIAPGADISESHDGALTYTIEGGEVLIALPLAGLVIVRLFNLILRARSHHA